MSMAIGLGLGLSYGQGGAAALPANALVQDNGDSITLDDGTVIIV